MVKAHFKDHNIVLTEKGWEKVPEDAYGSPPPILGDSWKSNHSKIVVLIASLRESRLADTLISMFDNAAHKERVHAVVVQQNTASDEDIIKQVCERKNRPVTWRSASFPEEVEGNPYAHKTTEELFINSNNCWEFNHIRVLRLDASEAKGPVYARGRQVELVDPLEDEFCMQIDAHTTFKKEWEFLMQQQYGMTENEFAVLSTYPTNYKDLYKNSNNHWEMPHLCGASISAGAMVRNNQASAAANLDRPILAPLWAAGLSFSKCHAEINVPNDYHLEHVFTGEEYARGSRLWTHGYDFYTITRPIIGVYYGSDKGGKGGWKTEKAGAQRAHDRMATLLKTPGSDQSRKAISELGTYGLGKKRTLEQYARFSGVDTINGKTRKKCLVRYVPYPHDYSDIADNRVVERPGNDVFKQPQREQNWRPESNSLIGETAETGTLLLAASWIGLLVSIAFLAYVLLRGRFRSKDPIPVWKRHILRQRKQLKSMV